VPGEGALERRAPALGQFDPAFACFTAALADKSLGARILPHWEARTGAAPCVHDIFAATRPIGHPLQELDHDQAGLGFHVVSCVRRRYRRNTRNSRDSMGWLQK
jgi:hypothetical protein